MATMTAGRILKAARRTARLTQRELARRAAVPQPMISRIERGIVSPTVATLERLLRQCGLELETVRRVGEVDRTLIQERLRLTPGQRAAHGAQAWKAMRPFRDAARPRG
jgi:transcriptional regulator with XRE-family HTH domain